MSSRIGICSFAGGLALFLWGFFTWAALDIRMDQMQSFKDADAVTRVLAANTDGHGVYIHPLDEEGQATGPLAFVIFRPGPMYPMSRVIIRGFLICCVVAGLVTNLLIQSKVETYGGQILYCVVICLTAGFLVRMSDWNWWYFPTSYILMEMLNLVMSGVVLGLVIGKLITSRDKSQDPKTSLAK